MNIREVHFKGWGLLLTGLCAAGLLITMATPSRAQADLMDVHLTACLPAQGGWCREIDQIKPDTSFGIEVRLTVGESLSGGNKIYIKGPEGTTFSTRSQWRFIVGQHYYEQRPYDVIDDGRQIRASVFSTLYPPLGHGQSGLADFAEVGTMTSVSGRDSWRIFAWTDVEDTPVASNSIKVSDAPSATPGELKTKIVAGPKGNTRAKRVSFRFRSKGANTFGCQIDSGSWKTCSSPQSYRVARGKHTFRVRAVAGDGKLGKIVKRKFKRV